MKEHPTCPECGSSEIRADAYAAWDDENQEWMLQNTHESYFCDGCGTYDINLIWKESEA